MAARGSSALLCIATLPVLVVLLGAEEVVYAEVGGTVTLKPPDGFHLQTHYLQWYFGGLELAWRNPHGGTSLNSGELRHVVARFHRRQIDHVKSRLC